MREGLDFVLRFTVLGLAVLAVAVGASIGLFLVWRHYSRKAP